MIKPAKQKLPLEHAEQVRLIAWVDTFFPDYGKFLYAVPNGGLRDPRVAIRLKAEGVRPGVPDLVFAQARGVYHGLFIEMKRQAGGRLSTEQKEWRDRLLAQGYAWKLCEGEKAARCALEWYWGLSVYQTPPSSPSPIDLDGLLTF